MIGSPCHGCIFFDPQARACKANEFCVQRGELVIAPGLCKIRRDARWEKKKLAAGETHLLNAAVSETWLSYDLIVLYDQEKHDLLDLCETVAELYDGEHGGEVIVIDVGKPEKRSWKPRKVIDYIKEYASRDIKYELMMDAIEDPSSAVHWVSRLAKKPYFLVIEAGRKIDRFYEFVDWFDSNSTRAVFYTFPIKMGDTHINTMTSVLGLYVTSAYRAIGRDLGGVRFREKLAEEERAMGISLVWHSDRGVFV